MKATKQTLQEVERALRKVTEKFPPQEEATQMTDIHFRVSPDSGELMAFDDDDKEINRCVVEEWIDNKDDDFYTEAATTLRFVLNKHKDQVEKMSILKPFSFVLEDDGEEQSSDEHKHIAELFLVDDDTVIIDDELMAGLDEDLNNFLSKLLEE